MKIKLAFVSLLFSLAMPLFAHDAFAQIAISVDVGPPPLPVYEQPICPADGFLWTPGYWAYANESGYYWVPGTWVEAPQAGFLWTPAYWGWGGGAFLFHEGYWGPEVGFYGGINYGYGYGGLGYEGGRWEGGRFLYNVYVNRVNTSVIRNTYNTTVHVSESHVSYNGGNGGLQARPSPREQAYGSQHHVGPVAAQSQHVRAARSNPELRASANHGKPPIAATGRAGDLKTGVVPAKQAGGEYKAPPRNHASELQPHAYTPPNTGRAATDTKYKQQQTDLAAQQAQHHQQLQQQQEQEHQQAAKQNYNDAQRQQMEQRHTQETQQLEERHATQQQQMEQRQAPPPRQESRPAGGGRRH